MDQDLELFTRKVKKLFRTVDESGDGLINKDRGLSSFFFVSKSDGLQPTGLRKNQRNPLERMRSSSRLFGEPVYDASADDFVNL